MQSAADGEYKWIMHYQDHLTKSSYLRALPNKKASRVALELLKIFLMQGNRKNAQKHQKLELIEMARSQLEQLCCCWFMTLTGANVIQKESPVLSCM